MPYPHGKGPTRYRWKTTKTGKKVRLGFRGPKKVVEVKKKGRRAKKVR